jgi:hypothetical protein
VVRVPKRLAVVVAVSVAAAAGVTGSPAPVPALAPAVAGAATKPGPIDRAVARLQAAQRSDGGFAATPNASKSDPVVSVWATLALTTVGIHPADQPAKGTTAYDYLTGDDEGRGGVRSKLQDTSDIAAVALVMNAIGEANGPTAVAAVSALVERRDEGGGFPETPGGKPELKATALAMLALVNDPVPARRDLATKAAGWLTKAFYAKGWGPTARARPRPDTTGLALQALWAVEPDEITLTSKAQAFLNASGNGDGGFGGARPSESQPLATAWVMQGLQATGIDPKTYSTGGAAVAPKAYLTKAQDEAGGFGDTLTTAQILPGFNATGFAVTGVKRGSPRASDRAGTPERKHGAAAGDEGGSDAHSGATTDGSGSGSGGSGTSDDGGSGSGPTGGGTSTPAGTGGGTGTPAASVPDTPVPPAATPPAPASTPTPAPTPAPAPAKPADDTVAAAGGAGDDKSDDPPAASPTQQVNGVVVGARAAAASSAPGVAAGAGGSGDSGTAVLGGLIVALVLVGTQLERRRPRRIAS